VHEPTSHAALAFVERLRTEGLVAEVLPTPTFALSRAEFTQWAGDRETFRMGDFYRAQRRRFNVLTDGGEPVGGKWNYDQDNREPPPKGKATLGLRGPWQTTEDAIDEQVRVALDALDLPTIGRDGPRWFAVTAAESRRALAHFVRHRLPHFGPPEDAMLTDDWAMAHSLLSVPLNLGRLHPLDVVRAAEAAHGPGTSRWPAPRASSGRCSAGASTCGICTGTSGGATGAATRCGRIPRCPTGGPSSTPTRSPPPACAARWRASATVAGPTTSSG
jgi:deoxyribodipyrimidine photolyase-related protein